MQDQPKPRIGWTDRAVLAALFRILPKALRARQIVILAHRFADTAAWWSGSIRPRQWTAPAPWQRFRRITLPVMAPGTTISVTISLITTLKLYDIIVALTSGGPADSTQSTALYIINLAFTDDRFGYASAVAMLLLLVSAVIALSVTGLLRRREVDL